MHHGRLRHDRGKPNGENKDFTGSSMGVNNSHLARSISRMQSRRMIEQLPSCSLWELCGSCGTSNITMQSGKFMCYQLSKKRVKRHYNHMHSHGLMDIVLIFLIAVGQSCVGAACLVGDL